MRTIMTALLSLSAMSGVSASAFPLDCKVSGWNNSLPGQNPIFTCPDERIVD
jgi:hypothetical protein